MSHAGSPDFDNLERLYAADITPDEVAEIADAAAWTYDVNRKPKGKKDGALGTTGVDVYRSLFSTSDFEPELDAFAEYRPYTAHALAERTAMSIGAVRPAVNRLIDHGFVSSGLCGSVEMADDLVQEAMLKAWANRSKFQAGTNFKAWAFTILRNHYFTLMRRRKFVGEWDDLTADRLLAAPASQDKSIELRDMMRALQQLPAMQREALILVGAGGLPYEETAEILGVPVGTVKSRVARGRDALEALIAGGQLKQTRQDYGTDDDPVISIFSYLENIRQRGHGIADRTPAMLLPIAA